MRGLTIVKQELQAANERRHQVGPIVGGQPHDAESKPNLSVEIDTEGSECVRF